MDLQLAAIAGARVDRPDAQCASEDLEDTRLQRLVALSERLIGRRSGLGDDPDAADLPKCSSTWLQVMPAVGQIEGFVDQRKIRHDVVDDRMLDHRPVLPRWIVRMAAAGSRRRHRLRARAAPGRAILRSVPTPNSAFAGRRDRRRHARRRAARRVCARIRRSDSAASSKRTATRAATSPSVRAGLARRELVVTAHRAGRSAGRTPARWHAPPGRRGPSFAAKRGQRRRRLPTNRSRNPACSS